MTEVKSDMPAAERDRKPGGHAGEAATLAQRLRAAGLRATCQRLAIARLLLDGRHRHVSAESLALEVRDAGNRMASGTIYNTLNQFTQAGLLRKVPISGERCVFDTNTEHHHHFYDRSTGVLTDIPDGQVELGRIPPAPCGHDVHAIEVTIHTGPKAVRKGRSSRDSAV